MLPKLFWDISMTLAASGIKVHTVGLIASSSVLTMRTVSVWICHISTRMILLDKSFPCQAIFPKFPPAPGQLYELWTCVMAIRAQHWRRSHQSRRNNKLEVLLRAARSTSHLPTSLQHYTRCSDPLFFCHSFCVCSFGGSYSFFFAHKFVVLCWVIVSYFSCRLLSVASLMLRTLQVWFPVSTPYFCPIK